MHLKCTWKKNTKKIKQYGIIVQLFALKLYAIYILQVNKMMIIFEFVS